MITTTLSKAEALRLFEQNAVLFFSADGILESKVYELFGSTAATYFEKAKGDILQAGRDYNGVGSCTKARPMINYFTKSGFLQIVAEHNYILTVIQERAKESKIINIAAGSKKQKGL